MTKRTPQTPATDPDQASGCATRQLPTATDAWSIKPVFHVFFSFFWLAAVGQLHISFLSPAIFEFDKTKNHISDGAFKIGNNRSTLRRSKSGI